MEGQAWSSGVWPVLAGYSPAEIGTAVEAVQRNVVRGIARRGNARLGKAGVALSGRVWHGQEVHSFAGAARSCTGRPVWAW